MNVYGKFMPVDMPQTSQTVNCPKFVISWFVLIPNPSPLALLRVALFYIL